MTYKTLLVLLFLGACASRPTPYGEMKGPFGSKTDETSSVFLGNKHTTSMRAFHFSKLAAIESCFNKRMLTFLNETTTEMRTQLETNGPGFQSKDTKTEGQHPFSTTTFRCVSRVQALRDVVQMYRVPPESIGRIMKDGLGGVLIKEAAVGGKLESGDIILQAFNKRVDTEEDLIQQIFFNPTKLQSAHLMVNRNGKLRSITTVVTDISQKMLVLNFYEVQKACSQWKKGEPTIPICTKTRTDWEKQVPL